MSGWWQRFFSGHPAKSTQAKNTQTKSARSKQDIGRAGEDAAARYVQSRGMRILYRNWRCGSLELDMVCEDAQGIIFVEVKTRKSQSMTSPVQALTHKKRATLAKAAAAWLAAHEAEGVYEKPCRFAVVAVLYTEPATQALTHKVELYDHAFDLSELHS